MDEEDWCASCAKRIVKMNRITASFLLIINVFFPGVGTIIMSFMGGDEILIEQLIIGVLQMVLISCLIGWIWSIYWGIIIYRKSYDENHRDA